MCDIHVALGEKNIPVGAHRHYKKEERVLKEKQNSILRCLGLLPAKGFSNKTNITCTRTMAQESDDYKQVGLSRVSQEQLYYAHGCDLKNLSGQTISKFSPDFDKSEYLFSRST